MGEITSIENAVDTISLFACDTVWIIEYVRGFSFGGLFSDEDIIEFMELGEVLREIRMRLVAEGKMPDNRTKD